MLHPRCKGCTLSRHVRGLGFDSRVRTLFSMDLCCIYLVFTMLFIFVKRMYSWAWSSAYGVKVARFPGMSEVSGSITGSGLCPRCKGSTLSRHVRGLRFDSRVRTLFSMDLCCIYLVFTMLFIFVKRMYIWACSSVHGVKVARFSGMSEVSDSIPVSGLFFYWSLLYLPCVCHVIHLC